MTDVEPAGESVVADGGTAVVFVDLVAFTALTDVHGDVAGADAASTLEAIARHSLEGDSRLVKTLGDGVLLVASEPQAALTCAATIVEALHDRGTGSDARGGLDYGVVIERNGDVFGSTVNLAARLAAVAGHGKLAVTRPVALAAGDTGLSVAPLGQVAVRGFRQSVEVFEVDPCQHGGLWLADPVCGMRVDAKRSLGNTLVEGREVGFCSQRCERIFWEG